MVTLLGPVENVKVRLFANAFVCCSENLHYFDRNPKVFCSMVLNTFLMQGAIGYVERLRENPKRYIDIVFI